MTRTTVILMVSISSFAAALFGLAAQADNAPAPAFETRVVFIVHPGPANPPGRSLVGVPAMRDHGMHMGKLFDAGKLASAGPFADGTGGFGITAKGVTLEEMTTLAAEDPAAKSGLITYEIKAWQIRLGTP